MAKLMKSDGASPVNSRENGTTQTQLKSNDYNSQLRGHFVPSSCGVIENPDIPIVLCFLHLHIFWEGRKRKNGEEKKKRGR